MQQQGNKTWQISANLLCVWICFLTYTEILATEGFKRMGLVVVRLRRISSLACTAIRLLRHGSFIRTSLSSWNTEIICLVRLFDVLFVRRQDMISYVQSRRWLVGYGSNCEMFWSVESCSLSTIFEIFCLEANLKFCLQWLTLERRLLTNVGVVCNSGWTNQKQCACWLVSVNRSICHDWVVSPAISSLGRRESDL